MAVLQIVEPGPVSADPVVARLDGLSGDARSRGQIMADTLVERLTGQTRADVNVEVQIAMPIVTLLDPDDTLSTSPSGQLIGGDPRQRDPP